MNKLNVVIALIAGIGGGVLSRYIAPPVAFAQDQSQITKELRAQSFTLVDSSGGVVGTFTSEPGTQKGDIVLRDPRGKVIWHAGSLAASFVSANSK